MRWNKGLVAVSSLAVALVFVPGPATGATSAQHAHLDCEEANQLCTEVMDANQVFGYYVGHDEPATLFYSTRAGSGNRALYNLTLPTDPPPNNTPGAASYNFQLHPAFWFGMAMCDTQSYPEQLGTCTPDSDSNIVDPKVSAAHAGTAFMEMQFYPPGWAPFQLPGGISCSATQWCAALNIDSLSLNPVTGQQLNSTCAARTGVEYVNFAFITTNGVPQAPPNPVNSTLATFTPDSTRDLFMSSGDRITVAMQDTSAGLRIDLHDVTSGHSGFMVASANNGFGQVRFAPAPSKLCENLPYDFHPMYSTSSPQTRVPWAAHTYNIAFSDEIGHFDYCTKINSVGQCRGLEGAPGDQESFDKDDTFCLPAAASTLVAINGCAGSNVPGFDGTSYLTDWPDGAANHPAPVSFTSPLTGARFNVNYSSMGFETDLPRVEQGLFGCNPFAATGCTHIPTTDDGTPAQFYPFFSTTTVNNKCAWVIGNDIPGVTVNDFGQQAQYGDYDTGVYYTGTGGTAYAKADDFRNILANNPCPA